MRKYLLFVAFSLISAHFLKAQELETPPKTAISVGGELAFPSRSLFSIGYGASAKFELPVHAKFGVSLTGGYSSFSYKGGLIGGGQRPAPATFVPLKAGILYYGSGDFFLEAEAGMVIPQSGANELTRNLFAFSFGPSIMFHVNDDEHQRLNVGIRYEKWSQGMLQQIALRAAYRFGW